MILKKVYCDRHLNKSLTGIYEVFLFIYKSPTNVYEVLVLKVLIK